MTRRRLEMRVGQQLGGDPGGLFRRRSDDILETASRRAVRYRSDQRQGEPHAQGLKMRGSSRSPHDSRAYADVNSAASDDAGTSATRDSAESRVSLCSPVQSIR